MLREKQPLRWATDARSYNAVALGLVACQVLIFLLLPGTGWDRRQLPMAIGCTVVFALGAWLLRGVSRSGALAGAGIALLLYLAGGAGAFLTLLCLFLLSWAATRIGYERKQLLGVAEHRHGRSAAQVVANLYVASLVLLFGTTPALVAASVAALAEAAADTASSEVGQAVEKNPLLVTTFEPVAVGTNGGISLAGTLAGLTAALAVAAVAVASGWMMPRHLALTAGAGFLGMLTDSVLGATLERAGWLNNDAVNAASTSFAALFTLLLLQL